jgi:prepilin signal peptidase PulO-like enzyme (type II secretory pathway)
VPDIGWIFFGLLVGVAGISASSRIVAVIDEIAFRQRGTTIGWLLAGGIFGAASGWFVSEIDSYFGKVVLAAVTLLTVVQTPIDLRTHRLSRPTTIAAATVISMAIVFDAIVSDAPRQLITTFMAAVVVTSLYALLHRLSPRSLGWGDVLLVFPLAVALGDGALDRLVMWQLLATLSAAAHAVIVRFFRGTSTIPFGPHLLASSWVTLVAGV